MEINVTTISFTGDFTDRQKIEEALQSKGIKVSKDVSKKVSTSKKPLLKFKVNYLCVGQNAKANKIAEALRLNLPMVSPTFLEDIFSGKPVDINEHVIPSSPGKRKRKMTELGQDMGKKTRTSEDGLVFSSRKSRVVALEGEIGAGKRYFSIYFILKFNSTLCRKFESTYPEECASYQEQTNEQFLKLFYGDPVTDLHNAC